jgi:hypothetical protein
MKREKRALPFENPAPPAGKSEEHPFDSPPAVRSEIAEAFGEYRKRISEIRHRLGHPSRRSLLSRS